MPIILQDTAAWERVLKLFGVDNPRVLSLDNGILSLTADLEKDGWIESTITALNDALNDPESMRAKVKHALPADSDRVDQSKINKPYEWPELNIHTLFARVFKAELFAFLSDGIQGFDRTSNTYSWEFSGSVTRMDKFYAQTRMLQSAASSKTTVLKAFNENNPSNLLSDTDACSEFAADIFTVTRNRPKALTVHFNHGLYLQELASIDHSMRNIPIVAVRNRTISIHIKSILDYLHTTFNDLIVLNKPGGDFETLLSSPDSPSALSIPNRVQVLIDTSGSMQEGFADYIYMIKTALIKAFETCQQLKVDITPFNHAYYTRSFNNPLEMSAFIDTLRPYGSTNINCPLIGAYQNVSNDEHATIYLFTDGKDNTLACGAEEVETSSVNARQNPNMMSYFIPMGNDTDLDFFQKLSDKTGFTCLAFANETQAIDKIAGILHNLCLQRELWVFIDKEHTRYALLESGDLKLGPVVTPDTMITRNGKAVVVGTQQPGRITNNLFGMFQRTVAKFNPISYMTQGLFNDFNGLQQNFQHALCAIITGLIAQEMAAKLGCPVNDQTKIAGFIG